MSGERSLLERLANPHPEATRTARRSESQLIASVLEHIGKMLNTRRGNAPVAPDYGIPDLPDLVHSFPASIRLMEQAIRITIEKYEPRLSGVRVKYLDSEDDILSLHFDVTAVLALPGAAGPLSFRTRVESNGEVSVTG